MNSSELKEQLKQSDDPEILKALDKGWEPPPWDDAIDWWSDIVFSDPGNHIDNLIYLIVGNVPDTVLLDEVYGFFEASADKFLDKEGEERNDDIVSLGWDLKEIGKESDEQKQFRRDMDKADREFEFYRGRFFYRGWATRAENFDDLQEIIRSTKVKLQWDQLGREGYIVYL